MAFDHYAAARALASDLDRAGESRSAERLRDAIDVGSTATEILTELHGVLSDLRRTPVPPNLTADVDALVIEIERSLPGFAFTG